MYFKWPGLIVSFKGILISTKFSMSYASIFSFSLLSVCTVYVNVSTPHICLSVYSYLCFNSFIFMSILHLQATFTFTQLNRWTWGVIQKELRTKKVFLISFFYYFYFYAMPSIADKLCSTGLFGLVRVKFYRSTVRKQSQAARFTG